MSPKIYSCIFFANVKERQVFLRAYYACKNQTWARREVGGVGRLQTHELPMRANNAFVDVSKSTLSPDTLSSHWAVVAGR